MGRLRFLILASLVFVLTGCVAREDTADKLVVTYELWVGFAAILGGLAFAALGWFFRKRSFRGWMMVVIGLIAAIGVGPFGFVDHVTVTNEKLSARWGIWLIPTTHEVVFDDIQSVTMTKEVRRKRRGRKSTTYKLNFAMKTGPTQEMAVSNRLMQEATDRIREQLDKREIAILDQTGD